MIQISQANFVANFVWTGDDTPHPMSELAEDFTKVCFHYSAVKNHNVCGVKRRIIGSFFKQCV